MMSDSARNTIFELFRAIWIPMISDVTPAPDIDDGLERVLDLCVQEQTEEGPDEDREGVDDCCYHGAAIYRFCRVRGKRGRAERHPVS